MNLSLMFRALLVASVLSLPANSFAEALSTKDNTQLELRPMTSEPDSEDLRLLAVTPPKGKPHTFELSPECGSALPYTLGPLFEGSFRKFIAIKGRYCFYLYDLENDALTGPLSPTFTGEGADSQSGMVTGLQIAGDGTALVGYLVDSGPFLYTLVDLSKPKEVPSLASYAETSLFVLPYPGWKKFRVLRISQANWELVVDEVSERLPLQTDADEQVVSKPLDSWVLLFEPKSVLAVDLASERFLELETNLTPDSSDEEWREVLATAPEP